MAGNTSNEFSNSINDYVQRPYHSGMIEHEQDLSTIILYTDRRGSNESENRSNENFDYLNDLTGKINSLLSESVISTARDTAPETPNGKIARLSLSSNLDYYGIFNNFSLMAVQENQEEIVKIHQNLGGSWNVFFFGEKPNFTMFTGVFIDSKEYPYYQEFMTAYNRYLSGRRLVEGNMRMTITYDGKVVEGFIISISTTRSAETNFKKDFQFTMLVKNTYWIRNNLIVIRGADGRVRYERRFNGLSNINRLQTHLFKYGIDEPNDTDSGGTIQTNTFERALPPGRGF